MPYTHVKTLHELVLISQNQHRENQTMLRELNERMEGLEEFQKRIKLGQRWLLWAAASLGAMIATSYYLLSSWHLLKQ